jgi:hypothetical protein
MTNNMDVDMDIDMEIDLGPDPDIDVYDQDAGMGNVRDEIPSAAQLK